MPAAREFDPIKRMAARKNPRISEEHRSKIQTSQLINRLTALVNGSVEMPPHAVTAALGLLRKTVPDLSSVEMSGESGGPIEIVIRTLVGTDGTEISSESPAGSTGVSVAAGSPGISVSPGGIGV